MNTMHTARTASVLENILRAQLAAVGYTAPAAARPGCTNAAPSTGCTGAGTTRCVSPFSTRAARLYAVHACR